MIRFLIFDSFLYKYLKRPEEFKALIEMDPYLHVKKDEKHPAVVVTTGMNDSRLPPWMTGKFAAKLQDYTTSDNPVLFIVDYEGGHQNSSVDAATLEWANICAFAFWQTGHPDYQYQKPDPE